MFDFLKPLIGSRSYLGVDIGTTSIKLVEVSKGDKRPKLKNYGILETYNHLERVNNAIQANGLKIMEKETAELLKTLLKKAKINSRNVIASLPSFSVFTTLIEIPQMSKVDTAKTISFQIRQYIPLPVTETAIEWLKVGEKEDEQGFVKQQMLIISIPNEQINRYKNIFKLAGLKLIALEMESLSLIRALIGNDPTATLLVDIGSRSTNIAVCEKGFLKYNSQTDFAGASLTQAISGGLNINVRRAEELKKQKGLLGAGGEYELSTLTIPYLDVIINEAERATANCEKSQGLKVERVVLAGGGANLLGIDKYFEGQLKLPTVIGAPFLRVEYPAEIEPMINELGPAFSVAIGLGIKEIV